MTTEQTTTTEYNDDYVPHIPNRPPYRHLMAHVFHFLFWLLSDLKIEGREKLPTDRPFILVLNHLHLLDAPLMYACVHHLKILALVGISHRENRFMRTVIDTAGAIWLRRDGNDMPAIRVVLDALKQGYAIGIAPEGTRSRVGHLIEAKEGAAFLASNANVPIYPIGLSGTTKVVPAWKRLGRARVHVRVGDPFNLKDIPVADRSQRLKTWTDEIMCRIAALLEPDLRGFYADHPRLLELLGEAPPPPTG